MKLQQTMFLITCTLALCLTSILAQADTPLHTAARQGDVQKCSEALAKDPESINVKGGGGQTALVAAALAGQAEVVKLLLVKGADATIPEMDGYTVMHAAGFQGRADVIQVLLDAGLDPVVTHSDGFYPLHRACWGREKRHSEAVEKFISVGGVDAGLLADTTKSAKTCAQMTQNEETVRVLKEWYTAHKHDEL